jgi:hypothetical protein
MPLTSGEALSFEQELYNSKAKKVRLIKNILREKAVSMVLGI